MRLESALYTGREGLTANGQAISVVGDNISNSNTVGFKASRAEFRDMLGEIEGDRTAGVPGGAGDGATLSRVRTIQEAGIIESTGRELDVGISGGGLFIVGDPASPSYTRAGNFEINEEGLLTTANGQSVLGYVGGSTTLSTINMYSVNAAGTATSAVTLNGNLDANAEITTLVDAPTSFSQLNSAASFSATQSVFDSLGARHDINVFYFKTDTNTWTAQAYIEGSQVGEDAGVPVQIGADVAVTFDGTGQIDEAAQAAAVITATPAYANGASAGNFTINVGNFSQYAGSSIVNNVVQDGQGAGNVKGYEFDSNGAVFAILDTGSRAALGTIPLATFRNLDGLQRVGTGLYQPNQDAGEVVLGTAGTGLYGTLEGHAVERSTVDIADQFVNLVLFQRGYQANSQILSTASGMLRDTLGLIR